MCVCKKLNYDEGCSVFCYIIYNCLGSKQNLFYKQPFHVGLVEVTVQDITPQEHISKQRENRKLKKLI